MIACPCSQTFPHDPHIYYSFIAGGPPGPVPTVGCVCPGRIFHDDTWRALVRAHYIPED